MYRPPDHFSAYSSAGQAINVTAKTTAVVDAIVVKGGQSYNLYSSVVPDMIAPLNNGGLVPSISFWFICYQQPAATPTSGSGIADNNSGGVSSTGTSTAGAASGGRSLAGRDNASPRVP